MTTKSRLLGSINSRPRVSKLRSRVISRDRQLVGRDRQLVGRDRELVSRDRELVSRDRQLVGRDRELVSRDCGLAKSQFKKRWNVVCPLWATVYNCNQLKIFLIMLNFGNFDLSYADSNAFWEFFGILDIVPVLACFCKNT